jgi:hypothetical protein
MIIHKMIHTPGPHKGAFIAGADTSGLTVYAYPTSRHANAAYKHPYEAARDMLKHEAQTGRTAFAWDAANWLLLDRPDIATLYQGIEK